MKQLSSFTSAGRPTPRPTVASAGAAAGPPARRRLARAGVAGLMLIGLAGLAVGCGNAKSATTPTQGGKYYVPTTLRIGLIPNIAPDEQRAKYEPFGKYMEKRLGVPVDLYVATNYAGVVQAMVNGKLDLAYFGGLTYAQALQQVKLRPIVTEIDRETGTEEYWSLIITRKDSGIKSLADLKGKAFAFGDPSSTSGSLFPRAMLFDAGYDWKKEFKPIKQVIYTGGHDATAGSVVTGKVDAGGIEGRVLAKLVKEGTVDGSQLVTVERRLVQGYPWCVPDKLDPDFRDRLVQAFLAIKDPGLLDLMRAKRYVKVGPEDYTEIVRLAKDLGLAEPKK